MERLTFARARQLEHTIQPVPAAESFGIGVSWISPGQVSVIMPIPPDARAGRAEPPASLAALVADTACGGAVVSAGHPRPAMTLSMSIDFHGDIPASGHLHCQAYLRAHAGHADHGPMLVDGSITDADDRDIASVTSWWIPGREERRASVSPARFSDPAEYLDHAPDLVTRFGLSTVRNNDSVRITASRLERYVNRRNALHGGVGALLACLAGEQAELQLGRPPGRTLSLSITYLAPTGFGGSPVTLSARVLRSGSRFTATEARLLTPEGADAVVATSTSWHDPERPPA